MSEVIHPNTAISATPLLYAKPAYITKDNTCNRLTYSALAEIGVRVHEWTVFRAHCHGGIGLHIHWPEGILRGKIASTHLKLIALATYLDCLRACGKRIIWTAHNVDLHSDVPPAILRRYWATLLPRVDGIIAPSRVSIITLQDLMSKTRASPRVLFAQFGGYPLATGASTDRALNRLKYGLPAHIRIGCMIGRLVGYRELVRTAEAFVRANVTDVMLLIAGAPTSDETATRLSAIANQYPQVRLLGRTLSQQEFDELLVASDVALFPYGRITNSGAVLHALSRNTVCITSELPLFEELRQDFGSDRVRVVGAPFRWWEYLGFPPVASGKNADAWITTRWRTHAEAIRSLLLDEPISHRRY